MSTLAVDSITKADGSGSLSVPAETGTVVTTASPSLGRRNLIINGAMQVAQRGTSASGLTSGGYYTVDRFKFDCNQATWTLSQESDAPTEAGLSKSAKYLITTAKTPLDAGGYARHAYRIEGQDLASIAKGSADAKEVTVSFWVKSNKTGTYILECYDTDNTRQISKSYTIDSSDTWEKKIITFAGDTSGTLTLDNTTSLHLQWMLLAGSNYTTGTLSTTWTAPNNVDRYVGQVNLADATNNYWQITGVQLEVGSVATPFEHRSYGEELALCQRYYREMDVRIGCLPWTGTNSGWAGENRQISMRAAPTVTQLVTPTYSSTTGTVPNSVSGTTSSVNINHASTSTTFTIQNNATGSCVFAVKTSSALDAEL